MKKSLALLLILFGLGGWTHGKPTSGGYAELNLGGGDLNASSVVNMFKASQVLGFASTNAVPTVNVDIYGIPISTTGWTSGGLGSAFTGFIGQGPLVLLWSYQRTFSISMPASSGCTGYNISGSISGCSASGWTVTSKGPSGGTVSTCGIYTVPPGTGGCVVFTTTTNFTGQNFLFTFPQTGTYAPLPGGVIAGPNDIALVIGTNMPLLVAGQTWTNEFLNTLRGLPPKTIRTMGMSHFGNDFTNQSMWKYRSIPANFSFAAYVFSPTAWGGTLSSAGSTTYPTAVDQYIGSAATDTPVSYTDGEVWQGIVTSASTKITISGAVQCSTGAGCTNNTDILLTVSSTATLAPTGTQPVWISGVSGTLEANSNLAGGLQPTTISVVDGTHIQLMGVTFFNAYSAGTNPGVVGTQMVNIASRGVKFLSDRLGQPFFNSGATTDGFGNGTAVTLVYDSKLGVMKWGNDGYASSTYSGVTAGVTQMVPWEAQAELATAINAALWVNVPMWATDDYVTNMASLLLSSFSGTIYLELSNEVWNFVYAQTTYAVQVGQTFGIPNGNNEAQYGYYSYRFKQITALFVAAGWPSNRLRPGIEFQATGNVGQTISFRFNGTDLGGLSAATITGIAACSPSPSCSSTKPTVTISPALSAAYVSGQALVLSGIVGTGCTTLNGTTVYVAHTPAPTTTSFVLDLSQQAASAPIDTSGCSYSSGGTATPLYNSLSLPNWSAYPNRPIDVATSIGYSSYPVGTNFNNSYGVNAGPAMGAMQTAWLAGDQATALALLDRDFRYGTEYNSSSSTLTFTCPASSTTISVSNTLSSLPSYSNPAGGTNVTLGIFTTTGQTCGGLTLNTTYCLTSLTGSSFSVSPMVAPGSGTAAGSCGSPITVTNVGASGTQTVGVTIESSFAWLNALNVPQWEWSAAQYDADGRATPVAVELYEGGMQEVAPTIAQCTTMGLSATSGGSTVTFENSTGVGTPGVLWSSSGLQNGDRVSFTVSGGSLPANVGSGTNYYVDNASAIGFDIASTTTASSSASGGGYYPLTPFAPASAGSGTVTATYCQGFDNLLNAYKQHPVYGKNYVLGEFEGFMGTDPTQQNYGLMLHSVTPSWLSFTGYNEWSMLPGNAVQAQNGSLPPFQFYYGFASFTSAYP